MRVPRTGTGPGSKPEAVLSALAKPLRHFRDDSSGVTSVIFGLMFTVILLAAAMAIDYTRAFHEQAQEQAALDAAVLAAAGTLGQGGEIDSAEATARAFFQANVNLESKASIKSFGLDPDNGEIVAAAGTDHPTTLMRAYGVNTMPIGVGSRAALRKFNVEVALVLDNSSELAGQPIEDLKAAALAMTEMLYMGSGGTSGVKVGVIPFAGSVNIGSDKRDASWIDDGSRWAWDDVNSVHWENIGYGDDEKQQKVSRFTLFDRLGVGWAGCVEVRPAPYDVLDTPPDPANAATYFVPMFAPDEPDDVNTGDVTVTYSNSYLPDYRIDDEGACPADPPQCLRQNAKKGTCEQYGGSTVGPPKRAQTRLCKYTGATPSPVSGPNKNCDSRPLTPLTATRSTVDVAIESMTSAGRANIGEGVMWGQRVLSPDLPFTEGGPFNDPGTVKYMIILARGSNSIETVNDDLNKSEYTPWGFGSSGRLNPQSTQRTALTNAMDTMSRAACRAASDTGVKVYSIGFGVSDAHTRSMLQYCATKPSMNYDVGSGAELLNVFKGIAREIREIRLAG